MCRFLGCDAGAQPPTISLDLTGESAKTARHRVVMPAVLVRTPVNIQRR